MCQGDSTARKSEFSSAMGLAWVGVECERALDDKISNLTSIFNLWRFDPNLDHSQAPPSVVYTFAVLALRQSALELFLNFPDATWKVRATAGTSALELCENFRCRLQAPRSICILQATHIAFLSFSLPRDEGADHSLLMKWFFSSVADIYAYLQPTGTRIWNQSVKRVVPNIPLLWRKGLSSLASVRECWCQR